MYVRSIAVAGSPKHFAEGVLTLLATLGIVSPTAVGATWHAEMPDQESADKPLSAFVMQASAVTEKPQPNWVEIFEAESNKQRRATFETHI